MKENSISEDCRKEFSLIFDFYVEPGKEKEAAEYINAGKEDDFSPIQILFQTRPEPTDETKTFTIEEHTGFIRIIYWMLVKRQCTDIVDLDNKLSSMQTAEFDPLSIFTTTSKDLFLTTRKTELMSRLILLMHISPPKFFLLPRSLKLSNWRMIPMNSLCS